MWRDIIAWPYLNILYSGYRNNKIYVHGLKCVQKEEVDILNVSCKFKFKFIFFENPEGQWPMWATYLHTRAMFNIWHWQR